MGFAGVEVEGEVLDGRGGGGGGADEDGGVGGEGGAGGFGGFEGDDFADAAVGGEGLEVVAGEGAAGGEVVFADDPVLVVKVEGVDDVGFAGGDVGGAALAGEAEDGALAIEFVPAVEGGFDDDEILVGDPELGLGVDDGAVLQLGGFVVVET